MFGVGFGLCMRNASMIDNVNMDIFVCPVQININRPAILTFWFDSVENGVFYNGLQKKFQMLVGPRVTSPVLLLAIRS